MNSNLNSTTQKNTKRWNINITDISSPFKSTSHLESKILGNTNLEVFVAVLEGSNLLTICGDTTLPESTTFYDYSFNVPIKPSPIVNPVAKQRYKNIGIDIKNDPLQVKLSTGKGPLGTNSPPLNQSS